MHFYSSIIGQTMLGNHIPIHQSSVASSSYIYLIGGVHGDEIEGVYLLARLFSWLKSNSTVDLPLIVIPVLNIDGYKQIQRTNANSIDLNRNFPTKNWSSTYDKKKYYPGTKPASETENISLINLFNQYHPRLILTFHSWKPLLNINGNCKHIADLLAKYNKYPVQDYIGYPTPGSLGTFGPEKYNSAVLTFECPRLNGKGNLHDVWDVNKKGLMELFTHQQLFSI